MKREKRREAKEQKPAAEKPAHPPGVVMMKPRKKLFVALLVLLGLWSAALLVMYFKTVYPHRKDEPKPPAPVFAQRGEPRE